MKSDLDRGVQKEGGASIGGGLLLENIRYLYITSSHTSNSSGYTHTDPSLDPSLTGMASIGNRKLKVS